MSALEAIRNSRYDGDGTLARNIVGNRGPFAWIPQLTSGCERFAFYVNQGFITPAAADATLTVTNSGTIGMAAGGLAIVSGATSGNNTTFQYLRSIVPATAKHISFACRIQLTNVALGQFFAGFWNAQADPKGTAATDGMFISKDTAGTGVIKGNLNGASTAAATGTLATLVNTTDVEFGGHYYPSGATDGKADFWTRAAGAEGWGVPKASLTAASTKGPQTAQRFGMNITASSSAALTATIKWFAFAWELA